MEQFKRLISAAVILPPLLGFLYYASRPLFLLLVLALVALSLHEYFQMLALVQLPVLPRASAAVAFALVLGAYWGGLSWMSVILSGGLIALTVCVLFTNQTNTQRFSMLLHSLFGLLFIGWGLSHLVLLRNLDDGRWYIFFLCAILWIGDSLAMYTGKLFGRHKMAPTISPGKTWEGALGCLIGGLCAAVLGTYWFLPHLPLWQGVTLGVMVSCAAQAGDLGESLLKRYAGVKDSGDLIPGHGGLLDRVDSTLFAAPVLVYTLNVLLPPLS